MTSTPSKDGASPEPDSEAFLTAIDDLCNCRCTPKYSIEPHGEGHTLYWGRCEHKHGSNLMRIEECSRGDLLQLIVKRLNLGT